MVEKGERGERRFEFESDFFPSSSDKKLNNRLAEKKKQEIPERALLPFVTRSVLPPENFQARLVVFPRRRSRGRAGGNHRLFLFQNWVRHDFDVQRNEDLLVEFAFFSLSKFEITLQRKRVTETSPRRPKKGIILKNVGKPKVKGQKGKKLYYGLLFSCFGKSSLLNYTIRKHTAKRQRERERENTRAHPGDLSVPSELLKRTRANFLRIPRNKSIFIGRRSARERKSKTRRLGLFFYGAE